MRKHEAFRIAQLRICILITVLLLLYYGLPIDPNDGGILVDGTFQMGLYARGRPPAGYYVSAYPYANMTSDPTGLGKTKGSALQMVDESLEFRLLLTDRWHDPYGWRYFPQGRYIIYTLGALHVLLSVLRLVAYLVLEFPLMYLADDEDDDNADVNVGTAKVDKKNARHRTTSVLKKGGKAVRNWILHTLCCVDADEDQHDVEDQDKMSRRKKQQHLSHHIQSFHTPVRAAKQAVAKDPQDVNKDRLAELEAPPDKAMCLQIFGEMLGLSSWKALKRQWPAFYLMGLLSISLLGILSSPFYFVVSTGPLPFEWSIRRRRL